MKFLKLWAPVLSILLLLTACSTKPQNSLDTKAIKINLSDTAVTVDGKTASTDSANAVYTANDIIYYEENKDFTYGEGGEKDSHSEKDAKSHTGVHITKAGTYSINGKLSRGQIAVDLGKDAKEDPEAVVTLILGGVDITCEVAPAVIFYNVYECGNTDTEKATNNVDTSKAGANVIIADGTTNTVNGSYVEKIYKPDSVILSEDKTKVEDADKLHKYDGAFYSKMSMNIDGEKNNSGVLNINAQNEGLDSELHLTLNGGNINIISGNDGINTNEDNVSVTTINNGTLKIKVTGETGEGDGIDSNGWLVINGGTVEATACSTSGDAGIDSDMGIHINGGTVIATGNMLDRIEDSGQTYAVFNFAQKQKADTKLTMKNNSDKAIIDYTAQNDFTILIYSSPDLKEGDYSLWADDKQLSGSTGGTMRPNKPNMNTNEERPQDGASPVLPKQPQGEMPQNPPEMPNDEKPPENNKFPEGMTPPEKPEGQNPNSDASLELTKNFTIKTGANMFANIAY